MQVGKKLHLRDYYSDPLYQDKIPNLGKSGPIPKTGDNIYRPLVPGAIEPAHFEHGNARRWRVVGDECLLNSVARGQEFVFETQGQDAPVKWVLSLLEARSSCK